MLYIANFIISALVGVLLFVFKDVSDPTICFNIIALILTLETPTFYILFSTRKSLDKNDNELLIPSALVTGFAFFVNLIFYSICVFVSSTNFKLFILYTIIFHSIIVSILLIIKFFTDYIRQQHK